MRSRIEPMKKIARSLRGHRELSLNYFSRTPKSFATSPRRRIAQRGIPALVTAFTNFLLSDLNNLRATPPDSRLAVLYSPVSGSPPGQETAP